jgi:hypothetical protein
MSNYQLCYLLRCPKICKLNATLVINKYICALEYDKITPHVQCKIIP